jgi:hypothetical protein
MRLRCLTTILSFGFVPLFFLGVAHAQTDDLVTITGEETVKATSAVEAAREIQNHFTSETARNQVIEIIGDKRYQKNKNLVESKIVKNSAKFMPFISPGQPVSQPDGSFKMSVEIKLSSTSLRKMVVDAGLMNDAEGPSSLLPMVSFIDRRSGTALRWWQGEPKDEAHKFLSQVSTKVHERLQLEFSKQGFHMIKPLSSSLSPLPDGYQADRLSGSDLIFVSDFYGSPMILRGDVRFREGKESVGRSIPAAQIALKLEVIQAASGRLVAEVSRQFDTEPGSQYEASIRNKLNSELGEIAKDLASQVFEVWQRGSLNSNLVRLSINGRLTPKKLAELKTALLQGLKEVKTLKERSFSVGQVVFEMDYAGSRPTLDEKIRALHLALFDTRISDSTEKGLVLEVKVK